MKHPKDRQPRNSEEGSPVGHSSLDYFPYSKKTPQKKLLLPLSSSITKTGTEPHQTFHQAEAQFPSTSLSPGICEFAGVEFFLLAPLTVTSAEAKSLSPLFHYSIAHPSPTLT
jgi:hypothetical protein